MADVDMPDAPASAPVSKKKGAADGDAKEGKKRFEVKKVGSWNHSLYACLSADDTLVERRRALGVGHCGR